MSSGEKILVTGGCGYIGSHVALKLTEAGYHVIVIDDLSAGFREALVHKEQLYAVDIGDERQLHEIFAAHSFSAVLHFAASVVLPESIRRPLDFYQNNACNTLTILRACIRFNVKNFVFSSTAAVYGQPNLGRVHEDVHPAPENPYGRSKLASEWMIQDLARSNELRYMILRYFNVAGADHKLRIGQRTADATHLIKVACQVALGHRSELVVYGNDYATPDGTGVRDYIHIEDLAAAHIDALLHLRSGGSSHTLNVGYGRGYSVLDVVNAVQRVSGVRLKLRFEGRRPGDVASIIADNSRLKATLPWQPKYDDLDSIVSTALAWERKLQSI